MRIRHAFVTHTLARFGLVPCKRDWVALKDAHEDEGDHGADNEGTGDVAAKAEGGFGEDAEVEHEDRQFDETNRKYIDGFADVDYLVVSMVHWIGWERSYSQSSSRVGMF